MDEKTFGLQIVNTDGIVLNEQVVSLILPATDGKYGIMKSHASVIVPLTEGEVEYVLPSGKRETMHISGGISVTDGDTKIII